MKRILFTVLSGIAFFNSHAQEIQGKPLGGEYLFNPGKVSCVTESQRADIKETIQKNKNLLKAGRNFIKKDTPQQPSFIWPVIQAEGFDYAGVWGISNYIDHSSSDQILDFNCGNKSYDGHMGIDIFLWPFSWKQMEEGQADIIAAEAGVIISKSDGYFDQSCAMEGGNWNAVYVMHEDGSVAWYGHMKANSLTTKQIGESVAKGEFLGKVGSSGNSTGPHLHFEVYNAEGELIDPYIGDCNDLNTASWWELQKPYIDPRINAVLTQTAPPDFNDCPDVESANISTQFGSGDTVYGAIYLKDQEVDSNIQLRIKRPNGTYMGNWNFSFETYYAASYWYWTINPDMDGTWTWEAEYYGQTVSQNFTVGTMGVDKNSINAVAVYPNPTTGMVNFEGNTAIMQVTITDAAGRTIAIEKNPEGIRQADLGDLADGVYFLTLSSDTNKTRTVRIVRE